MITWTKHYQMWLWNLKPGDIVYVNQNTRELAQVVAVTDKRVVVTTPTHRSYALPRHSSHHTLYGQKVWISPIL
jgi:hypothetical protein